MTPVETVFIEAVVKGVALYFVLALGVSAIWNGAKAILNNQC